MLPLSGACGRRRPHLREGILHIAGALCCLCLTLAAPFGHAAVSSASAGPLRVIEAGGSVLELDGDHLVRRKDGRKQRLPSTTPRGPGAVTALVPDPWGVTFVVAEHGVFIVSPDVDVLDPIIFGDGAPPGQVRGLHLDQRRRLWVATDRGFGCVDAAFFYGRTLTPAVGPREAQPLGLRTTTDGAFLLMTTYGTYRYQPDTGPFPTISVIAVNGKPYVSGREVTIPYANDLAFSLAGAASGGATFRYRINGHHILRPVKGATLVISALPPGRHTLTFVSLDRDLNMSNPEIVPVTVHWPFYYSPVFVLLTTLGAALPVFAGFLLRQRRHNGPGTATARAALSSMLLLVVGLQLVAGLVPHARGWPFVGFSMYADTFGHNTVAGPVVLEGIASDGGRHRIRASDTGLTYYEWDIIRPLLHGDERVRLAFIKAYNERIGQEALAGFEVRHYRHRLTVDGPVRVAPIVLTRFMAKRLD